MQTEPQPSGAFELIIRPLQNHEEACVGAKLIVESEPWITLGRGFDHSLSLLTDASKEVYIAQANKIFAGLIVINMQGPFAGYIQAIVVVSENRNRGIGARLIKFAEERIFRESPNVFLCVSGFNTRARQFYTRLGYEPIGELKDYVIAGASEILMRKTIGPKEEFKPRS
ncbi:MAG: GCN5-related N-acetyltransferase [Pedosphaera sp.]|nr:GCN5-related N-acetyltransferase [Pedosphaera sp.]